MASHDTTAVDPEELSDADLEQFVAGKELVRVANSGTPASRDAAADRSYRRMSQLFDLQRQSAAAGRDFHDTLWRMTGGRAGARLY